MSANIPVLPIVASTLVRAFASLLALLAHWLKARARRHRREAHVLARFGRRMLTDIGINRADVRDAFSEPFWEDQTALLRERAIERRAEPRHHARTTGACVENGFRRPPTGRSARQAI